jgi:hypothetical protein
MKRFSFVPPLFGLEGIPKNSAQAMNASPSFALAPKSKTPAASRILPVFVSSTVAMQPRTTPTASARHGPGRTM